MAIVRRTRQAQWPLVAEFVFNYNDGMAFLTAINGPSVDLVNAAPVTDFGSKASPIGLMAGQAYVPSTNATTTVFEIIPLPVNAQVIGGDFQIEIPFVGPSTATLALGDMGGSALYMPATTLVAAAWTNAPTAITNATVGQPTLMTISNTVANGITAIGQVIVISGCTGAAAAYNGTFIVDSFTATSVTCTNSALTTSLTLAGTPAGTWIAPRTALSIPGESSNLSNYLGVGQIVGSEAAAGTDMRLSLTFTGGQAATQGRARVRVMYTIDGRGNENAIQ